MYLYNLTLSRGGGGGGACGAAGSRRLDAFDICCVVPLLFRTHHTAAGCCGGTAAECRDLQWQQHQETTSAIGAEPTSRVITLSSTRRPQSRTHHPPPPSPFPTQQQPTVRHLRQLLGPQGPGARRLPRPHHRAAAPQRQRQARDRRVDRRVWHRARAGGVPADRREQGLHHHGVGQRADSHSGV